jgi:hypothetical protein
MMRWRCPSVADESYQSIFENYIVQNVPFKGKLMAGNTSSSVMIAQAVFEWVHQQQQQHESSSSSATVAASASAAYHPITTHDFPLRDCANLAAMQSAVHIPTVVFNS